MQKFIPILYLGSQMAEGLISDYNINILLDIFKT